MVRTVEEHAEAIARLVTSALEHRGGEHLAVDAEQHTTSPDTYRLRVLVDGVLASIDLPPFDNSQMDGYAVASADLASGSVTLPVGPRIAAGHPPGHLAPGTAAPIMTGAPLPGGADAVIPIEAATPDRFLPETDGQEVTLSGPVPPEQFVRRTGSDIRAGDVLLERGTLLRAAHWGVLAASGVDTVEVHAKPRILVVSTGSELADAQGDLVAGTIHDANGASLVAALGEAGADVSLLRVSDDAGALLSALVEAAADADLVVTTGGVSAGAYEVVRDAFESRGVRFESVAMQPGGPQGWGVLALDDFDVPVICFPGNPVSVLVSWEAFLRVPLARALGRPVPRRDATAALAEGRTLPPASTRCVALASTPTAACTSSAGRARTCCTRTPSRTPWRTSRSASRGSRPETRS